MIAVLSFLRDYEYAGYYVLGLIALWYVSRLIAAQIHFSKSGFGFERELFRGRRTAALGMLALLALIAAAVFGSVHGALPQAQIAEQTRQAVLAAGRPTPTLTPTALQQFGVDVSGCTEAKATILQPKPGEAVKGKVTIRLTADIPNFAFYKLELARADEADVWVTLFTDNQAATEAEPFSWVWDSSTVTPGVYHLRLTVFAADLKPQTPCVVPLQVLSPGP